MKDFQGLIRDTIQIKNPPGTWQQGKNMVLTKGHKSLANEDGFKFSYLVKGTIIGVIATTTDVVFFSKNQDGTDEIGIVNTNNNNPSYRTIIKSSLFNFQYNCPIEGFFVYNYKNELIVKWSDGTKQNSNSPKILNTSNPSINLNPDGTLVDNNEFKKLLLFPEVLESNINIEYLESGNIDGFAAYITYAYVFEDNSTTSFFSTNLLAYLGTGFDPVDRKGVRLNFTNLDTNFNKLKIGIVIKKEAGIFGYESYIINYEGNTKSIDINTLSNFTSSSAESIILEKSVFDKIETLTKFENQSIVANVTVKDPIKFQKYANLLQVKPKRYISNNPQEPSLLPDEVYSLYIQLQDLQGVWGEAFHIPGRTAINNERDLLTIQQLTDYNLSWIGEIENSNFKQFHFFNTGILTPSNVISRMGYWENEETYPNTDDFNSSVDYNGNPLSSFVDDLRGKNIRYHRIPSINTAYRYGETELCDSNNLDDNSFYKIGLEITNFADVVPNEIKDKIQAYRVCIVKRNAGNSYVLGNYIMTRRGQKSWTQAGIPLTWEYYDFNRNAEGLPDFTVGQGVIPAEGNFNKSRLLSNELFKFRPSLDVTYIKTNYLFRIDETSNLYPVEEKFLFGRVINNIKYVPGNNIAANTQYHHEGIDIDIEYPGGYINMTPANYTNFFQYFVANITAYSHKTNVYSGFKSNNLVVLQRVDNFNNNVEVKGGDIFNNAEIDIAVQVGKSTQFGNARIIASQYEQKIKIKGLHSPLNSSQLFNRSTDTERSYTVGDNEYPERINAAFYNTRDYDFEIKHEPDLSFINDINTILTFDFEGNFINKFPFRIHRGLKIPNENLTTTALRTYLSQDYYEMPNDKGEIVSIRGTEKALFIQHRFTLFVANIKDKLKTQNIDAYLGESELFERKPEEVLSDDKGYIGCSSKFASLIIKGMYVIVNQINGQIFIIKEGANEISALGNKNWFWNNWDIGLDYYRIDDNGEKRRIDNPYVSVGHIVGYDKEFNRLLFTKKYYEFIRPDLLAIGDITTDNEFYYANGERLEFTDNRYFRNKSKTLSFNLEPQAWLFEHSYHPNIMFYTHENLYSITNKLNGNQRASIYQHNDKNSKGLYYGNKFDSYVDLIFNQNLEVTKLYESVIWVSDVINKQKGNEKFKTITHIMLYNNNQCSGIINLKDNNFQNNRNAEGEWHFNSFRDLVINSNSPVIGEDGELLTNNINNNKLWFEKSNFISKFIVVRLIIDNIDNNDVFIHEVKVKSLISKR